ncbi:uncharacterized protein N7515_006652 [Penicillium bovifimosum]|uniref:RRM domain-containing protein n=1 Tax=Penicillium bovifimosum TaxID=126998 RepID=A0A9W9GVF9_9EURO|nr:uncharacterized protein N7515_006652 [Penicillium bovifimosum]KAJ5130613.1 hypothetical protein N7515_006652 [Penicillium bovifimosum]
MLKPFQIRDLRASPSQHPEQLAASRSTPSGVVQISAADYDALASNHPRARLTYVDEDDDDETITVGSALELSQRLDEPLDASTRLESLQLSDNDATPMHIFDIRRSNSVTELWKRFEGIVSEHNSVHEKNNTQTTPKAVVVEHQPEVSAPNTTSAPPVSEEEPRSFMEAFEADLAEMLNAAESSDNRAPRTDSPPPVQPSDNTNSGQARHPVEILAAQVLTQLISGATMVQSEWRAKLPELQRQLQNAQRQFEAAQQSLPGNMEASLRSLLATVDAQLRAAFSNLPDNGRQMAEDAFQAGRPVAENAADGLRSMAAELNEVGRTLFAAFESEFGQARPTASASTSNTTSETRPLFDTATSNQSAAPGPVYPQSADTPTSATATKGGSPSIPSQSEPSDTAQAGVLPRGPRRQFMNYRPNHWAPMPWQAPAWRTEFPHQAGSPSLYYSHPPVTLPTSPYWPQWTPGPARFGFNAPRNARQTSRAKSGEPRKDSTSKSLFIGNVGFQVTDKMIQDVFASKGFLVKVDLPLDTASGRHAGFGYVHFPSEHPAFAAMESLHGTIIDGHSINLELMDHTPIESVRPAHVPTSRSQAETGDLKTASSAQSGAMPSPALSPRVAFPRRGSSRHGNTDNRRKSVTFEDHTQIIDPQIQTESSALLDSPSDDPAFSARFPSLLPEMSTPHTAPLGDQEVPSHMPTTKSMDMSRFPPVSQREAQLLAKQNSGVTESSPTTSLGQPQTNQETPGELYSWKQSPGQSQQASNPDLIGKASPAADAEQSADYNKAKLIQLDEPFFATKAVDSRRATGHGTHGSDHHQAADAFRHSPLMHSASMRHLGDRSRLPLRTSPWARLSRRERNGPSSDQQVLGRSPVEATMQATTPRPPDAGAHQSDDPNIQRCVAALLHMGYGTEQDGGRSRLAVYAAAANGALMDAIDMIEEERRVYERRASQ